jgi:hypothetical protein
MARIQVDIEASDLRERLGLTRSQLPDNPTPDQIQAAFAATEGAPRSPHIPEGMVLVERERLDYLHGEFQAAAARERDEFIAAAMAAGKFAPSRRQHYTDMYNADPQGTTELILAMAPNMVPVEQRGDGRSFDGESFTSDEAYPAHWLPEVAAAQGNGPKRVVVGVD